MSKRLSPNFIEAEFKCRCGKCAKPIVKQQLLDLLEAVRKKTGPLHIISGYRCPAYNRAVGGVKSSQHMLGFAADVVSKNHIPKEIADMAEPIVGDVGGLGRYATFTHIDARGKRARWGSNS